MAPDAGEAREVYCGRSFQEAASAARVGRADFSIISGGLGLIHSHKPIPAYSLSLVRQSSAFIGSRVIGTPFDAPRWWSEIQRNTQTAPIAALVRANRGAIVVIGISTAYLALILDDLLSLFENDDIDRVRLFGMGIDDLCPLRLQSCILPYDSRIDGPDSPIVGTRGDFPSRAMRHFVENVLPQLKSYSIEAHKAAVVQSLKGWRWPKPISRPSRSDDEIIQLLKKNWRAIEGQSSKGLRYLRDVEEIACEQGRFRVLFQRASREVDHEA
jgi:hypothetical protein